MTVPRLTETDITLLRGGECNSLPIWQWTPSKPCAHVHTYWVPWFTHTAPFKHGLLLHRSVGEAEKRTWEGANHVGLSNI